MLPEISQRLGRAFYGKVITVSDKPDNKLELGKLLRRVCLDEIEPILVRDRITCDELLKLRELGMHQLQKSVPTIPQQNPKSTADCPGLEDLKPYQFWRLWLDETGNIIQQSYEADPKNWWYEHYWLALEILFLKIIPKIDAYCSDITSLNKVDYSKVERQIEDENVKLPLPSQNVQADYTLLDLFHYFYRSDLAIRLTAYSNNAFGIAGGTHRIAIARDMGLKFVPAFVGISL